MNEDPNEDPAAAADDPMVELPQSKLNAMMASARRQGRGEKVEKPTSQAPAPATIAEIVAATVAAMQQQSAAPPRIVAAAPSAPSPHQANQRDVATGLVDPFQKGHADALGPRGVRAALEAAWGLAADRGGAPVRPKPPR